MFVIAGSLQQPSAQLFNRPSRYLLHHCRCACLLLLTLFWLPSLSAQNLVKLDTSTLNIVVEANVAVTMRDGIDISVDIYRPAGTGTYPALYASAPYPHSDDINPPNNSLTGPVAWYVNQGYTYVLASSRGTGRSEGNYELLSRDEQQDHYEIIEWIAEQPWSNGKVAGIGASYYATSQWLMAIQSPPHLECIAPFNGVVAPYQDWAYPGGLISNSFIQDWYEQQVRQSNAFPQSGPARLVEYDLRLQQLLHPYYDDYWRLRSSLEGIREINVPVFIMASWKQNEPGLDSTFKAIEHLNSTHKIIISGDEQSDAAPLYQDPTFLQQELMPFYEWCLNDRQTTSFIEQPRIRYYVRGQNQLKRESSWPPGNINNTPLFLNAETLSFDMQTAAGSSSSYGNDNKSLTFISEVLEQDTEITGPVSLELYASSSSTDTAFAVTLSEQLIFRQITQNQQLPSFLAPNTSTSANLLTASTQVNVSSGSLKASARAGSTQAEPLTPNRVTRFDIMLKNTAYRFKRGSRIVLKVQQINDGSLNHKSSQGSIFHNNRYPSRLWLPITQSANEPTQNFTTPDTQLPRPGEESTPDFDFLNTQGLQQDEQSPIIYIR